MVIKILQQIKKKKNTSGRQSMANMEVHFKGDKSAQGLLPKCCALLASHGT